jgi:kinetochore protein NDC80
VRLTDTQVQRTATARQHLSGVEAEVAAQNLSPDEISRMQHDKVALAQQLQDIGNKIAEVKRQRLDQEVRVTNCMDECEQQLDAYDLLGNRIYTLGVTPDPLPTGFVHIDYSLNVVLGAEDVQAILRSGRAKLETIRPALDSYAQGSRDQIDKLCEEETALERKHQDLMESVDNKREEVLRRKIRYDKERKQVDEQREVSRLQ